MTIQLRVSNVTRRKSSEVPTIHYTYVEGEDRKVTRSQGAEWEEIEFMTVDEDKPTMAIANIPGDIYISDTIKMFLHNPILFGTYQVGDLIEFMPKRLTEAEKTQVDNIVVPTLAPPAS